MTRKRMKAVGPIVASIAVLVLLSGCVSSMLATRAVKAPNQQMTPRVVRDDWYAKKMSEVYAGVWRLPVGPPAAELSVAVVEPGNYQFQYRIDLKENERGHKWLEPGFEWKLPAQPLSGGAIGTILILHGYADSKENMLHWALVLAQTGYRCVLVDFRGHGQSSGAIISFGAFEVKDLSKVLDELQRRNLMESDVGVLGVSYGASVGLLLAAQDARVGPVVALEPFSDAAGAVVEFAHGVAPTVAAKISERQFSKAVALAARRGNFSWSDGDVLAAMERIKTPVLLYHGAKDRWLSPDNSRRLIARAPEGSRLGILENDDHLLLSMRLGDIVPDVQQWFQKYLKEPGRGMTTAQAD